MTPEMAAARIQRFATDLPAAADRALGEALKLARERAIWWSSGPLPRAEQRRMGGPYARAERGQSRPDPGRINIAATRAVVEGWAITPIETAGGVRRASLYNTAPEARFLYDTGDPPEREDRGTLTMLGRPLPDRVLEEIEGRVAEIVGRALDSIMGA